MQLASATLNGDQYVFALCDAAIVVNNLSKMQESSFSASELKTARVGRYTVQFGAFEVQTLFSRAFKQFFYANSIETIDSDDVLSRFEATLGDQACIFEALDFKRFTLILPDVTQELQYNAVAIAQETLSIGDKTLVFADSSVAECLRQHIEISKRWFDADVRQITKIAGETQNPDDSELSLLQIAQKREDAWRSCQISQKVFDEAVATLQNVKCLCAIGQKKGAQFSRARITLAGQQLTVQFRNANRAFTIKNPVFNLAFTKVRAHALFYALLSDIDTKAQVWKIRRQLEQRNYTDFAENANADFEDFDYLNYNQPVIFQCDDESELLCLFQSSDTVKNVRICFSWGAKSIF